MTVRMRVVMMVRIGIRVAIEVGVKDRLRLGIRMGRSVRVDNEWWAMNVPHILLTQAGRSGREAAGPGPEPAGADERFER